MNTTRDRIREMMQDVKNKIDVAESCLKEKAVEGSAMNLINFYRPQYAMLSEIDLLLRMSVEGYDDAPPPFNLGPQFFRIKKSGDILVESKRNNNSNKIG